MLCKLCKYRLKTPKNFLLIQLWSEAVFYISVWNMGSCGLLVGKDYFVWNKNTGLCIYLFLVKLQNNEILVCIYIFGKIV